MSEPKPLTKERREQIEHWLTPSGGGFRVAQEARFVRELLAAEQFWREAFSKINSPVTDGWVCDLCGAMAQESLEGRVSRRHIEHQPDCAWKLSREI